MLTFKIIQKCYQDASKFNGEDADFYIELDGWNDKGYHVMYHLHATKRLTGSGNVYLGYIKFMHPGQKEYEAFVLHLRMGDEPFVEVAEDIVGITFSIDVYKGLNRYVVDPNERKNIVKQLHLILDKKSPYYEKVKDDPCFIDGMMRDMSMDNYALKKAHSLLVSSECLYNLRKESFIAMFPDEYQAIKFKFSCLDDKDIARKDRKAMIPNGVMVFIGANGSGKSTLMYRLARLMYTYPEHRSDLIESTGIIEPNNLGISKMILVSYSPFDNFSLPLEDYKDRISSLRLVYCGLRDLDEEYNVLSKSGDVDLKYDALKKDRQSIIKIKDIGILANEFADNIQSIKQNAKKLNIWKDFAEAAEELHRDISLVASNAMGIEEKTETAQYYVNLSTGNKYLMHMLSYVVAYIEDDSLLLFDEPENHIHPPLLSFLLAQLREILLEYQSVMFISTHSPVILQEVFADNVYIVRNDGSMTVTHPEIETYGANIAEITAEVFKLTSDDTGYYRLFYLLFKTWEMDDEDNVETMLASFEEKLGHAISEQLTAYLIDLYLQSKERAS
jgi:ABC-type multidrug transport system ATPase subunit